jgi:DNA-binding transcriptional ArsR family regulator
MSQREPATSTETDQLVIRDVETLKAVAEPTRIQLLVELCDAPRTVKELAEALGVAQTSLYYHVKILERHGLIEVVDRRMVSGIEERRYAGTSPLGWTIAPELSGSLVDDGVIRAVLNSVRAELELALGEPDAMVGGPDDPVALLSLTRLFLSPDDVVEVRRILGDLMERYSSPTSEPGKRAYHAFFTTSLAPTELRRKQ